MYRTKAIYQLSDLNQSSLKILRLFKIYRQSGSQAPVLLSEKLKFEKIFPDEVIVRQNDIEIIMAHWFGNVLQMILS